MPLWEFQNHTLNLLYVLISLGNFFKILSDKQMYFLDTILIRFLCIWPFSHHTGSHFGHTKLHRQNSIHTKLCHCQTKKDRKIPQVLGSPPSPIQREKKKKKKKFTYQKIYWYLIGSQPKKKKKKKKKRRKRKRIHNSQVDVMLHESHAWVSGPALLVVVAHDVLVVGVRMLCQVALDQVPCFFCWEPDPVIIHENQEGSTGYRQIWLFNKSLLHNYGVCWNSWFMQRKHLRGKG